MMETKTNHEIRKLMLKMSKGEVARIHELRKAFTDAARPYGHLLLSNGTWVLSKRQALNEAYAAFLREKEASQ